MPDQNETGQAGSEPRPSPIKVDAVLREAARVAITGERADVAYLRKQIKVSFGVASALAIGLKTLGITDETGKVIVPAGKVDVVLGALMRHQHVGDVLALDAVADQEARRRWLPSHRTHDSEGT